MVLAGEHSGNNQQKAILDAISAPYGVRRIVVRAEFKSVKILFVKEFSMLQILLI